MRFNYGCSIAILLLALQGCSGGGDSGGGQTSSQDPGDNQIPPLSSGADPVTISDCSTGTTPFMIGDTVNKTITPTEIEMIYGEDGSQSGCVVSGGAEIERSSSGS